MQTTTSPGTWNSGPAADGTVLLFQFAVVFSPVSICCGAFLLFQFAAVLSLVSDSCASPTAPQPHSLTASQRTTSPRQDSGTCSGPISKKHNNCKNQPARHRIAGRVRGKPPFVFCFSFGWRWAYVEGFVPTRRKSL